MLIPISKFIEIFINKFSSCLGQYLMILLRHLSSIGVFLRMKNFVEMSFKLFVNIYNIW